MEAEADLPIVTVGEFIWNRNPKLLSLEKKYLIKSDLAATIS